VDVNILSRDNLLPLLSPFLSHLGRWRSCTIGGAKEEAVRFGEFWDRGNGEPKLEELDIGILDPSEMDEMADQIQILREPREGTVCTSWHIQALHDLINFQPSVHDCHVVQTTLASHIKSTPLRHTFG
jgi:hypothetical protein